MKARTYKVTNTGHFEVALATDGEYGYFKKIVIRHILVRLRGIP